MVYISVPVNSAKLIIIGLKNEHLTAIGAGEKFCRTIAYDLRTTKHESPLTTPVKISIGLVLVAALFLAARAVGLKDLASKLSYKIIGFGRPGRSGEILSIPLTARITNQSSEQLTVDAVQIVVSHFSKDRFIESGGANITGFTLVPGFVDKTFTATANLKSLAQNALDTLSTLITNRAIRIKADVTLTVAGVKLPTQTIIQDVQL